MHWKYWGPHFIRMTVCSVRFACLFLYLNLEGHLVVKSRIVSSYDRFRTWATIWEKMPTQQWLWIKMIRCYVQNNPLYFFTYITLWNFTFPLLIQTWESLTCQGGILGHWTGERPFSWEHNFLPSDPPHWSPAPPPLLCSPILPEAPWDRLKTKLWV